MSDAVIHMLRLNKSPFSKIKCGLKTIEMRLLDEKRMRMRVGDLIRFHVLPDEDESVECKIIALHRFSSFAEMCEALPLANMGYEGQSLKAWQDRRDHGMSAYYSAEEELNYGVVGIEFVRLDS